jgi:hypothetical protein
VRIKRADGAVEFEAEGRGVSISPYADVERVS